MQLKEMIRAFNSAPSDKTCTEREAEFKNKLFELLYARSMGKALSEFSKADSLRKVVESSKTFKYANIWSMDSSHETLKQIFGTMDVMALSVMEVLLFNFYLTEDFGDNYAEEDELDFEGIYEEVNDTLETDWGATPVSAEDIEKAYRAALLVSEGKYDEALKDYIISEFASGICSTFDDYFDEYFVLDNISLFTNLFWITENNSSTLHVIASKEIKEYLSYRENVPFDLRECADELIDALKHPFSDDIYSSCNSVCGEEYFTVVAMIPDALDDSPYTENDLQSPIFTAIRELDSLLPKLRENYGSANSTPNYFFCQNHCSCEILRLFAFVCYCASTYI